MKKSKLCAYTMISALALFITNPSALACTTSGSVAACGGDSGNQFVACQVFPPVIDYCAYTDSVGYVTSCLSGYTTGSQGCKPNGNATCNYTRTFTNCCGMANPAPVPESTSVAVYTPDGTPCGTGG